MFGIEPKFDAAGFIDSLSDIQQSQLPFATVHALSWLATNAIGAEQTEMRRVFNAPVAWTLDSMYADQASKGNPVAHVRFKDERTTAGFYLKPDVEGGPRRHTMFEGRLIRSGIMRRDQYAVPLDGAERDGSGNVSPGQILKILSDLKTVETARSGAGARNAGVRSGQSYFATIPGAQATAHMKPGIYKRGDGRGVTPVFAFTTTRPRYRDVFKFDSVAQKFVDANFAAQLWSSLEQAVASSTYKGKWRPR